MGIASMTDEAVWKKRFLLVSLVRLSGTAIALLGVALIVVGLVDLAIVPRILSRRWRQP